MKKKKMVIKIKTDVSKLPNKMHFEVQKTTRAHVFIDRKKRSKNGYKKHKGQGEE